MSVLSNASWTFIDEHRSSSLIVKSSGDMRGIRDRTYDHFSASLSIDLLRALIGNVVSVGGSDHEKGDFQPDDAKSIVKPDCIFLYSFIHQFQRYK